MPEIPIPDDAQPIVTGPLGEAVEITPQHWMFWCDHLHITPASVCDNTNRLIPGVVLQFCSADGETSYSFPLTQPLVESMVAATIERLNLATYMVKHQVADEGRN